MDDALRLLAVLGLVAGNAFFVAGEYAVVAARRSSLGPRAEAGSAGARAALRLMDDPVRVISTVQVGITAIGILIGALGEPLVRGLLGEGLPRWAGFLIAFSTVTYLSVVLGELVPKALTLHRAEAVAVAVAPPIDLLSKVLRPAVSLLQGSAAVVLRPFGVGDVTAGEQIRSPEELRALVDEAEGAGVIPRAQEELLHNVLGFSGRQARDVMVPAHDVAWLDAELTVDEALGRALEMPHGRYPVGRGSLDRLAGVVHVRDLAAAARAEPESRVGEHARPALVVPGTKELGALLREIREQRRQLVVVADEYGGTAGVVSLEDVLEELVGEIEDEFDEPAQALAWRDERTLDVPGAMPVEELNRALGTALPQRAHTLGGLAFDALGRRPAVGDSVDIAEVRLRVEEVDELRIVRLRIELPEARDAAPATPPAA